MMSVGWVNEMGKALKLLENWITMGGRWDEEGFKCYVKG